MSFGVYEKQRCFKIQLTDHKCNVLQIYAFEKKLPTRSYVIIRSEWIWDLLTRNLTEIRLRDFLYQGTMFKKNQPEVSAKVVSISRVLTAFK